MMVVRGGEGGVERGGGGGSACAPVHSNKYFSSEVKHPD